MTYKELYESAIDKLEKSKITLGEFEKMIEPLNAEIAIADTDTISRQAAIDETNAWLLDCLKVNKQDRSCGLIRRLEDLPSAEPKRGKWIRDGHHIRCDQCGMYMCDTDREGDKIPNNFCPNCGIKMEEK